MELGSVPSLEKMERSLAAPLFVIRVGKGLLELEVCDVHGAIV
jgi:hypothetical protein